MRVFSEPSVPAIEIRVVIMIPPRIFCQDSLKSGVTPSIFIIIIKTISQTARRTISPEIVAGASSFRPKIRRIIFFVFSDKLISFSRIFSVLSSRPPRRALNSGVGGRESVAGISCSARVNGVSRNINKNIIYNSFFMV